MKKNPFEKFQLKSYLLDALERKEFVRPTEVQERVIPKVLAGKSVIGQSQTGTGKTHAFLLPILSKIDESVQEVQGVITAPTRELARQIYLMARELVEYDGTSKVSIRLFVGGTDKNRYIEGLKKQPQLVIGTPGRIIDLVKEEALSIHTARYLVVDEADLMLDLGFLDMVDQIAVRMPKDLQMLVFSATIPKHLEPFLKKYMEQPEYVQVDPKTKTPKKIHHSLLPLRHRDKTELLFQLLKVYNPFLAIVFANTKKMVDELADELAIKGLKVGVIHGDLTPRERKKMMNQIHDLKYQYIIATDLAARGIDIDGVSHVIHYELPSDLQFYIHRSGRTGRGQYEGISTVLFETKDEQKITKLEKMGIYFDTIDINDGEIVHIQHRNKRSKRTKPTEKTNTKGIKPPKKVKPGYKKKLREQMEKLNRKQKRKGKLN
ncbi:DEAD/DEAH box helicase [Fervidibacillus halotolerans]|uniref:DEAD-box ATP-dependent RNA helicase CshB n=1 Tax=Fervidibacillus halotolerans TaxID=2980027 RepID=A0A9E8LXQ6_9BACI|nr:DEAD/DEAH box helicase [Fervidibacillus halotolerans]WAA11479.1 DEAD/DEAH box helicase [Fervidibacillus halotolerans]